MGVSDDRFEFDLDDRFELHSVDHPGLFQNVTKPLQNGAWKPVRVRKRTVRVRKRADQANVLYSSSSKKDSSSWKERTHERASRHMHRSATVLPTLFFKRYETRSTTVKDSYKACDGRGGAAPLEACSRQFEFEKDSSSSKEMTQEGRRRPFPTG
jgi:hypothetical protein